MDQIKKIEVFEDRSYRDLPSDELRTLVAKIEEERKKKFVFRPITSGPNAGYEAFGFKDGYYDSWLLDGDAKVNDLFAA